jgi:hypothetical protein
MKVPRVRVRGAARALVVDVAEAVDVEVVVPVHNAA